MEDAEARSLLERYETLIALYGELESISNDINASLESGAQVHSLTDHLKRNMSVAERIREESQVITSLKQQLSGGARLIDNEREQIKQAEEQLTVIVNRVVEQGNRSRDLMSRQGVKISRR